MHSNDTSFTGIWDELLWRGLVKDNTGQQELRTLLNHGRVTFYCGFDPTAPSLHVGNLLQLLTMRRLQQAGHQPLLLVGGSTGLIGDPRPTEERSLQDKHTVAGWVTRLQEQAGALFPTPPTVVNNLDWFQPISAIDFLRDVGKHFTVNTMLRKTSVQSRLNSDNGISFTEFAYQLLQASDFLHLNQHHGCILQTGGSDQWGNMVGGVELVKTVTGNQAHAFSTPLVMNSDGTKFGKSEGNAIWLDPSMTSPFAFFQFWLHTADADVFQRLRQFTFLTRAEIEALEMEKQEHPSSVLAQQSLAVAVTSIVHGEEVAQQMQQVSGVLFSSRGLDTIPEDVWEQVVAELRAEAVEGGKTVAETALLLGAATSLSDARRLIKQGGLSINGTKIVDSETILAEEHLIHGRFLLMKKGKKHMFAGICKQHN